MWIQTGKNVIHRSAFDILGYNATKHMIVVLVHLRLNAINQYRTAEY
jgi:hypothetical protein